MVLVVSECCLNIFYLSIGLYIGYHMVVDDSSL